MIPDEAVEAAAQAIEDQTSQWLYPVVGGNAHDIAAMALEAAAPYIAAQAWDEGWQAGSSDETDSYWGPCAVTTPNPYEKAASDQ